MKVLTLDPQRFAHECQRLSELAFELDEHDILIGIRSGGYIVAEAMLSKQADRRARLFPITRRRPSSAIKAAMPAMARMQRNLPYWVTDRIRLAEHRVLTRRVGRKPLGETARPRRWEPDRGEAEHLIRALKPFAAPRILIIDDAIDTGSTLKAVGDFVRTVTSNAVIRSAVIVTTTIAPLIEPDVTLYRNVLCRFPWSYDFHR